MKQENKLEWKKVLWQETSESETRVSQGYFYDEGEFVKLIGDEKEILIRKDRIISVQTSKGDKQEKWKNKIS